jgi:hypothetical protein
MDMSSRDPITELMSALDVATDAVTGDPRLEQAFTEAFAHIDAGDPDTAARVVSAFLNSVCATTALPDGVLTHDVIDDAARMLVEQRTRGRNRAPALGHGDRTEARANSGFPFLNSETGPP